MALRKLAETMIRIAGIFLALNMSTLTNFFFVAFSQMANQPNGMNVYIIMVVMFLVLTVPGLIMIFAPSKIVGVIMPASKKTTEENQDNDNEDLTLLFKIIEPIILSLAGLYFFVTGGVNSLSYGLLWGMSQFYALNYFPLPSMVLTAIFQFIAGGYLLFGAKGLQKMLRWVRTIHPDVKR